MAIPTGKVVAELQALTLSEAGDNTVVGKAASGSPPAGSPVLVAGSDGANVRTLSVSSAGAANVRVPAAASVTGTITASGQTVVLSDLGSGTTVSLILHGTFSQLSLVFEYSPDGVAWGPCLAYYQGIANDNSGSSSYSLISATAAATTAYTLVVPSGATHVRVRSTALTSGTANVVLTPDSLPRSMTGRIQGSLSATSSSVGIAVSGGTVVSGVTPGDAQSNSVTSAAASAFPHTYGGQVAGSTSTWARARHPRFFKTVTATASGDTALWTPTSGLKFCLLGGFIQIPAGATCATQEVDVTLRDATTALPIVVSVSLPSAISTLQGSGLLVPFDLGTRGLVSAAANNVLNVNLSAALTASKVRVCVWGVEE